MFVKIRVSYTNRDNEGLIFVLDTSGLPCQIYSLYALLKGNAQLLDLTQCFMNYAVKFRGVVQRAGLADSTIPHCLRHAFVSEYPGQQAFQCLWLQQLRKALFKKKRTSSYLIRSRASKVVQVMTWVSSNLNYTAFFPARNLDSKLLVVAEERHIKSPSFSTALHAWSFKQFL